MFSHWKEAFIFMSFSFFRKYHELLVFQKVPIRQVTHLSLSIGEVNMPRKWAAKLNLEQKRAQTLIREAGRMGEQVKIKGKQKEN